MRPPERSSLLSDLSHRMPHQPGHRGITISHKNPPEACRIGCTETIVRARGFFKVKVLDERHSFPEAAFPYRAFAALSRDEWQMQPEIPDQLFHGLNAAKHASSGVIEAKVPLRQESVTAAFAAALQAYCVRKQPAGSNRRHSSFPTAASEGVQDGNLRSFRSVQKGNERTQAARAEVPYSKACLHPLPIPVSVGFMRWMIARSLRDPAGRYSTLSNVVPAGLPVIKRARHLGSCVSVALTSCISRNSYSR